jgi:hypothetical protein
MGPHLVLPGLVLGLFASACGTNAAGLPWDAEVSPDPMKPEAGTRPPPISSADPDGGTPDGSTTVPPDAGPDRPPIMCNLQPNPSCTFGYHALKSTTPELVLVFDRSSAMLRMVPGTMQNRWNEMTAALEDNLQRTHAAVLWGLKLFPTTTMCNVTESLDVPVAMSNRNPIVTRIRGNLPPAGMEGSPLDLGIKTAARALRATPSKNPRYLILATDGIPNCPPGPPGENEAVKAVLNLAGEGLRTYVIGTATPTSPQHRTLNDLAAAGGEPRAGDQKYWPALDKAQMLTALDEITDRMGTCVLMVNALAPEPDYVALNIGNTRIPRDPARREGWNWGGTPQTVHVYGEACTMLKKNPLVTAELVFGCQGHAPPPPCGGN